MQPRKRSYICIVNKKHKPTIMTVTGINIEEKVRNYEGVNTFIKSLKPGLMKYGRLTPKQKQFAEKIIMNEVRQSEVNVEELPQTLQNIVNYDGELKFVKDIQEKYKKYRRLTDKQVSAANNAISREKSKKSQKDLNIDLVGNTIKLGRNIAMDIKKEYELDFHPILVDVTKVITVSEKAMKLEAKLTKENGGICRCCGRTLTDEMSQMTGVGPVCATYVGVPHPASRKDIPLFQQKMSERIDEVGSFEFWIPKRQIKEWNGHAAVLLKL